jgi:histidinol-phosphate aminotransferase
MQEALGTVHRYPDATGAALKAALAEKWGLSTTNVALGNGVDEWVLLLCLALLEPGDEVVMAWGSFINYWLRASEAGARVVRVPLRDHVHDLQAMAGAISERTRLVFVCNPNNPTGTIVDAAEVDEFVERTPERVLVVLDEAYYEYVADPDYTRGVEHVRSGRRNVAVLRSFSKVYGLAGLRVGYMLAHDKLVDYMERARSPFNVNGLAQAAALAALGDEEHLRRSIEANEAAKEFFYRELTALSLRYIPTHANFMAFDAGQPGGVVSEKLLQRGFIVTALDAWGVPHHVRFSFGAPEENVAFVAALSEIATIGKVI